MYFLREIFRFEIMCLKSVAASVFKVLKFLYWVRGIWLTRHLKSWRDIPKLQTYPPPLMSTTPFKWTIYIPSIIYIFGNGVIKVCAKFVPRSMPRQWFWFILSILVWFGGFFLLTSKHLCLIFYYYHNYLINYRVFWKKVW